MNKILPFLLFLFVSAPQPAAAQAGVPETTLALFDGQDLDSFYTWLVDTGREDPDRNPHPGAVVDSELPEGRSDATDFGGCGHR